MAATPGKARMRAGGREEKKKGVAGCCQASLSSSSCASGQCSLECAAGKEIAV